MALFVFSGLVLLIMAVLFRSSVLSFLSFFVHQKHHRKVELKLNEDSKTPELIKESQTTYRLAWRFFSCFQRFKLHYGLQVHFYSPVVSLLCGVVDYMRNICVWERLTIQNDPSE